MSPVTFRSKVGKDVTAGANGDRRASSIRVPVSTVRSPLPDLLEAELRQERSDFARFQDRYGAHRSTQPGWSENLQTPTRVLDHRPQGAGR